MNNKWLQRIVGLMAVLLVVMMAVVIYMDDVNQKKQSQWVDKLHDEARPYEDEIEQLQRELNDKQKNIGVTDAQPEVMLLLQIEDAEQLETAVKWLKNYEAPVTVVIDSDVKDLSLREILQKIKDSTYFRENEVDVMLSGNPSEKDIMMQLEQKKTVLAEYGIAFSNFWFLASGEETTENTEILVQNNFAGYSQLTDYGTTLKSGELENGLIYAEHVSVKTGDNKIESTLNLCVEQKKTIALAFDMEMLSEMDSTEADSLVDTVLSMVQTKQETKDITVHNISQMLAQNAVNKQSLEEQQAEYDQFEMTQQEKIDELQDKANEIYSRWEDWKK